jgi:8-oxo-dGTP pyrophosphatase MutT (NUDIX family)
VVRLVVLDSSARVLLLHTRDPTYPDLGTWWELPGGENEPSESYIDAAIRELRGETGMAVKPESVELPTWRRDASFRYRAERRLQHENVVTIRLTQPGPAVARPGRDAVGQALVTRRTGRRPGRLRRLGRELRG